MTLSDLIRCLLQLPDESIEGGARLVVVDRATAVKLSREMRRWGHHYNQAVHALNAIAYYLRANDMDSSDVIEELDRTSGSSSPCSPASPRSGQMPRPSWAQPWPPSAGDAMPMLKTIAGHTSARGIRRYLTKKNRALAEDLINIDAPEAPTPSTGRPS